MENIEINHFAVFVSAVANLALGALWYSPALFYEAWKKENQLTEEDFKGISMGKMYTISFLLSYVMAYNLAFFLGDAETDWQWGLTAGFLTGFGWVGMMFAVIAVFELKSIRYILINGGFIVIYFTLIGFILGIWR